MIPATRKVADAQTIGTAPKQLDKRLRPRSSYDRSLTRQVPPLRVVRQAGTWQCAEPIEIDKQPSPRKRRLRPPTAVEQKRARWEVLALVFACA